jgi:hypothetical protein
MRLSSSVLGGPATLCSPTSHRTESTNKIWLATTSPSTKSLNASESAATMARISFGSDFGSFLSLPALFSSFASFSSAGLAPGFEAPLTAASTLNVLCFSDPESNL